MTTHLEEKKTAHAGKDGTMIPPPISGDPGGISLLQRTKQVVG